MGQKRRHHLGQRNEGQIGDHQVAGFADDRTVERSRVDPLVDDHPRVGAQPLVEQAVADVDRVHPRRAALEEAVGEAAGRGADIEADETRGIDGEGLQGRRQLVPAAGDVRLACPHIDGCLRPHRGTRLVGALPVDRHPPGHDRPASLVGTREMAPFDQKFVQPSRFQRSPHRS